MWAVMLYAISSVPPSCAMPQRVRPSVEFICAVKVPAREMLASLPSAETLHVVMHSRQTGPGLNAQLNH